MADDYEKKKSAMLKAEEETNFSLNKKKVNSYFVLVASKFLKHKVFGKITFLFIAHLCLNLQLLK